MSAKDRLHLLVDAPIVVGDHPVKELDMRAVLSQQDPMIVGHPAVQRLLPLLRALTDGSVLQDGGPSWGWRRYQHEVREGRWRETVRADQDDVGDDRTIAFVGGRFLFQGFLPAASVSAGCSTTTACFVPASNSLRAQRITICKERPE